MKMPLFVALALMYLLTYAGEGLVIMYLFNSVRVNGMDISISALFSLVAYVPSLLLTAIDLSLHSRLPLAMRLTGVALARALVCVGLAMSRAYTRGGPDDCLYRGYGGVVVLAHALPRRA